MCSKMSMWTQPQHISPLIRTLLLLSRLRTSGTPISNWFRHWKPQGKVKAESKCLLEEAPDGGMWIVSSVFPRTDGAGKAVGAAGQVTLLTHWMEEGRACWSALKGENMWVIPEEEEGKQCWKLPALKKMCCGRYIKVIKSHDHKKKGWAGETAQQVDWLVHKPGSWVLSMVTTR